MAEAIHLLGLPLNHKKKDIKGLLTENFEIAKGAGKALIGTLLSGYDEDAPCIRLFNLTDNKKVLIMFTSGYPFDMYVLDANDVMESNPMYFDGTVMTYECDVSFGGRLKAVIGRFGLSWGNEPVVQGASYHDFEFSSSAVTDTNYGVVVTPNWNTTVYVTNKTTTSFRVNFGSSAPAGATIDALMFKY